MEGQDHLLLFLSKIADFTLYMTASVVSYKTTGKLRKTLEKEADEAP